MTLEEVPTGHHKRTQSGQSGITLSAVTEESGDGSISTERDPEDPRLGSCSDTYALHNPAVTAEHSLRADPLTLPLGGESVPAAEKPPVQFQIPSSVDPNARVNVDSVISGDYGTTRSPTSPRNRKGLRARGPSVVRKHHRDESGPITAQDVQNIFVASTTTAMVTNEQILRVKQMHDRISEGASFSFNYYSLVIIASFIAGLGLVSDSTTTVISSMLLSPLMGPVIGMSYGTVIWDWQLVRRSIRNEVISLILCILIGMIVALATAWTSVADDWPTNEMSSRARLETFVIGIPIAFFSGLGVALSVLDEQMSSLVGVAISASLLPPAVDAGIIFVSHRFISTDFSDSWVSLSLTIVNIVVIWLSAALMFRVKEVLPVKKKEFWGDLKTARRIYQRRALLEESASRNDFSALQAQLQEDMQARQLNESV